MSMQDYSISWSDALIGRVETYLRDIHAALTQHYKEHGYETRVPAYQRSGSAGEKSSHDDDHHRDEGEEGGGVAASTPATIDVISAAGSFLQRTCVHSSPYAALHTPPPRMHTDSVSDYTTPNGYRYGGAGTDLVLTIPTERCSVQDMREGRYLLRRRDFVSEVESYLRAIVEGAVRRMAQPPQQQDSSSDDNDSDNEVGQEEGVGEHFMSAAAARLARMRVHRLPIHGCHGNAGKDMLRISIARRGGGGDAAAAAFASSSSSLTCEVFFVDIHFRPALYCARAMNAEAARKHPRYTYYLLEDYHMPDYLSLLHTLCVQSNSLRQAIVVLKCWAHHFGLMAAASGHSEGLNGFILAALVYRLYEDGVLTAHMSAESVVRTVWVQISRGLLTPNAPPASSRGAGGEKKGKGGAEAHASLPPTTAGSSAASRAKMPIPAAEESGEVAVLRLRGEVMNILFRSSASFIRHVVQPAADEALQFALSHEVFSQVVFTPLPLRFDAALIVHQPVAARWAKSADDHTTHRMINDNDDADYTVEEECNRNTLNENTDDEQTRALQQGKGEMFSPSVQRAHAMRALLERAFTHRMTFCSVWPVSADRMQVTVSLSNESDGRSRLTRGPAIEQSEEVAAFNAFWGSAVTSTRQLPDGAIYRCVLWSLPQDGTQKQWLQQLSASATTTNSASPFTSKTTTAASVPLPPLSAPVMLRHIAEYALRRHTHPHTQVRALLGELEGVLCERVGSEWIDVAALTQPTLHRALRHVESLMTRIGASALPCKVTGFDVIAASARHTEVFPTRPHLALTRQGAGLSGAESTRVPLLPCLDCAASISPVHCVLTIDDSGHKIPDTPEAVRVMRGAICAQLAKAMEHTAARMARDEDEAAETATTRTQSAESVSSIYTMCTQGWTDIVHGGYLFRIHVAHYREVALLRALQRDAEAELLEQKLFWSVQHHKMIRALAAGHSTYSTAVRIAKRWLSAMLLSEFVLAEAVELLVAHAYVRSGSSSSDGGGGGGAVNSSSSMHCQTPRTAAAAFVRFLHLLATHDWTQPLRLGDEVVEHRPPSAAPEEAPAMFISAPYAPQESPFTRRTPRALILHRLVQLAQDALVTLLQRRQLGVGDSFARLLHTTDTPPAVAAAQCDGIQANGVTTTMWHSSSSCGATSLPPTSSWCAEGGGGVHTGKCGEGRTESALFRCSPRGFDLVMELHPQLILQPDRALVIAPPQSGTTGEMGMGGERSGGQGGMAAESESWMAAGGGSPAAAPAPPSTRLLRGSEACHVVRAPTRVYQLDELDERGRRAYLSQLAEREPAAYAIRSARVALRDVGMIFYDALAPRLVYAVSVSETVSMRQMQKMYVELMHAVRGGLLPTPVWVNAQQRARPPQSSPQARLTTARETVMAASAQTSKSLGFVSRSTHTRNIPATKAATATRAAAASATPTEKAKQTKVALLAVRRARSSQEDVSRTKRLKTSRDVDEHETVAGKAAPPLRQLATSSTKGGAKNVESVKSIARKHSPSREVADATSKAVTARTSKSNSHGVHEGKGKSKGKSVKA